MTDGWLKHLFQNNLMQVWVSQYITETDESVMSSSRLLNVVSGTPGVSVYFTDREMSFSTH